VSLLSIEGPELKNGLFISILNGQRGVVRDFCRALSILQLFLSFTRFYYIDANYFTL
jgi:hypothetical protein